MKTTTHKFLAICAVLLLLVACNPKPKIEPIPETITSEIVENQYDSILFYQVCPKDVDIALYWKDDSGNILRSFENLKTFIQKKNKTLVFATNGGMYTNDNSPLGLFIQNNYKIKNLNLLNGNGNFYLKPNGVFYLTNDNVAHVINSTDFIENDGIKFATQSGPMLVINGEIHPEFNNGSTNLNIRNGVGVLPNNELLFALSNTEINFYDFAKFFQDKGCVNALYLDGLISKAYYPEKNFIQTGGNFGVIIGVINK